MPKLNREEYKEFVEYCDDETFEILVEGLLVLNELMKYKGKKYVECFNPLDFEQTK